MFQDEGASTERTGTGDSWSALMTAGKGSRMGPENENPVGLSQTRKTIYTSAYI